MQAKFKYQLSSHLQLVVRCKHAAKGDQNPVGGREEEELLKGCHMPPQEKKVCNIFNVQHDSCLMNVGEDIICRIIGTNITRCFSSVIFPIHQVD